MEEKDQLVKIKEVELHGCKEPLTTTRGKLLEEKEASYRALTGNDCKDKEQTKLIEELQKEFDTQKGLTKNALLTLEDELKETTIQTLEQRV